MLPAIEYEARRVLGDCFNQAFHRNIFARVRLENDFFIFNALMSERLQDSYGCCMHTCYLQAPSIAGDV